MNIKKKKKKLVFFFNVKYNKINNFHEIPFIIFFKLPPNQAGRVLEVDVEKVCVEMSPPLLTKKKKRNVSTV